MRTRKLILVSANRHTEPYPVYPLGISYLNSYLSREMPEVEVYVFDFLMSSYEEYIEKLNEICPDYAGISLRNIDDVNIIKRKVS